MNAAQKLGVLFRRHASLTGTQNVRRLEERRVERLGASSSELNAKFGRRVAEVEARVRALEIEVLGNESIG